MPRLQHNQDDPLPLEALKFERLEYMWEMLQGDLLSFDDYTPLSKIELTSFLFGPRSHSFEVGNGVGLVTLVFQHVNAWVQMVMFDWNYRDYICRQVIEYSFNNRMNRVTSTVTEDRDPAKRLVTGLGFELEGTMRKAFHRQGKFLDIEVYGLTREKYYGDSSGYCRGSGISSSDSR